MPIESLVNSENRFRCVRFPLRANRTYFSRDGGLDQAGYQPAKYLNRFILLVSTLVIPSYLLIRSRSRKQSSRDKFSTAKLLRLSSPVSRNAAFPLLSFLLFPLLPLLSRFRSTRVPIRPLLRHCIVLDTE